MSKILDFILQLNGYDFSIILIVLVTIDIWASVYARAKIKKLVSDSWRPIKKYLISFMPSIVWILSEFLYNNQIMTIGGKIVLFMITILMTIWLAFSEFISITSLLKIAEPKTFKWAQKFAINYALPEIQKKMVRLDINQASVNKNMDKQK